VQVISRGIKFISFEISKTQGPTNHVGKIAKQIRGAERVKAKADLLKTMAQDYIDEKTDELADAQVVDSGDLMNVVSLSTARQIRAEALSEQDLHKDKREDLRLLTQKINTDSTENYIKTCNPFQPFNVTMTSDLQHDVLFERRKELHIRKMKK
jgi:hypothetical protein